MGFLTDDAITGEGFASAGKYFSITLYRIRGERPLIRRGLTSAPPTPTRGEGKQRTRDFAPYLNADTTISPTIAIIRVYFSA